MTTRIITSHKALIKTYMYSCIAVVRVTVNS